MAEFNRDLDKQLFNKTVEVEESKLTVGVYSYNEGKKKVQISRQNKNEEAEYGWTYSKLGRMTQEELIEVLPILEEAIGEM